MNQEGKSDVSVLGEGTSEAGVLVLRIAYDGGAYSGFAEQPQPEEFQPEAPQPEEAPEQAPAGLEDPQPDIPEEPPEA